MNKPLLSALIVLLSGVAGCGGEKSLPVLDLEAAMTAGPAMSGDFTLNEIFSEIEIIPIETRPDALVGTAMMVHIEREHVYIAHDSKLSRVERGSGRIVSTLSRQGRGPGEYLAPMFDVNEAAGTIRAFDMQSDKYITYDMNGNTLDEGLMADRGIELPRFIGDDYMIVRGRPEGTHRLYITDLEGNIERGIFPIDTIYTGNDRVALVQLVSVSRTGGGEDGGALVNMTRGDTLYRVDRSGIPVPGAILNKGRYKMPDKPIFPNFTGLAPNVFHYINHANVNAVGDYRLIEYLMITGRALQIFDRNGRLLAHTDSRDGFDEMGFRFVFPAGGEALVSSFHYGKGEIGFVIDALHAAGSIEGIKEDSNPVIVIATLKK
jgi:hypothetical protein